MMRKVALCFIFAAAPFLARSARAAQETFQFDSSSYTLKTGTSGGGCVVTNHGSGGIDVDCHDNSGNQAVGNTIKGCVSIANIGSCGTGGATPDATTATKCGNTNYMSGTGSSSGNCTQAYDANGNSTGSHCEDSTGNAATVDCTRNGGQGACDSTSGSGSCTILP